MESYKNYLLEEEEKETIDKNKAFIDDYPAAASKNAQKALDYKKAHGDEVTAMTKVGWERANQLANKEKLSIDVVSRIAQFKRHQKNASISPENKDEPWKDNGYVSWAAWGGTAGVEWAIKKMDELRKKYKIVG